MAGRPRTIDRDKVLDAAEAIVTQSGAIGLSLDAVAKAAGISKSGVQHAFGTRDNLISMMINRWGHAFDAEVSAYAGPDPNPRQLLRGHIAATANADEAAHSRSAAMMMALVQQPEQLVATQEWYAAQIGDLNPADPQDRRALLAFLACEGAFLLKAFKLLDFTAHEWQAVFDQISDLSGPEAGAQMPPPEKHSDAGA